MAFIDELTVTVKAGSGGDGVARFRHQKNREFGGPSGGDGGRGGSVYIRAVENLHLLAKYRHTSEFKAADGGVGGKDSLHGRDGADLHLELPVGSILTNTETGERRPLYELGSELLLLKGGNGGYGNEHFKSSTNQNPDNWVPGQAGESGVFHIEIELAADIGLIGLPSAGKSSLLNELSRASAKVGSYPFTTLEPNLGECHGVILADIPGLIEGAAEGKGLGHKFLRHVKRTKLLAHLVSLEETEPLKAYQSVRAELAKYDQALVEKPEIVLLSKTDVTTAEKVEEALNQFKTLGKTTIALSIYDDEALKLVKDKLLQVASKLT